MRVCVSLCVCARVVCLCGRVHSCWWGERACACLCLRGECLHCMCVGGGGSTRRRAKADNGRGNGERRMTLVKTGTLAVMALRLPSGYSANKTFCACQRPAHHMPVNGRHVGPFSRKLTLNSFVSWREGKKCARAVSGQQNERRHGACQTAHSSGVPVGTLPRANLNVKQHVGCAKNLHNAWAHM